MALASNILPEKATEETFARRDLPEDIKIFKLADGGLELISPKGGRIEIKAKDKSKTLIREKQKRLREGDARGGWSHGGDAQEGIVDSFVSSPADIYRKFKSIFDEDTQFQDPVKFSPGLMPGAGAASAVTFSDEGLRDVWLKDKPDWKPAVDAYGHAMVHNPETGQKRYVNPKGLGAREVNKLFGDALVYSGVGKLMGFGSKLLGKAVPKLAGTIEGLSGSGATVTGLREGTKAATDVVAQNAMAMGLGSEHTELTDHMLMSGLLGGSAAGAMTKVGNVLGARAARKAVTNRDYSPEDVFKMGPDGTEIPVRGPKHTSPLAAGAKFEDAQTLGQRTGADRQLRREAKILAQSRTDLLGTKAYGKHVDQVQPALLGEALSAQQGPHQTALQSGEHVRDIVENAFRKTYGTYKKGVKFVEDSGRAANVQIPGQDLVGLASDLRKVVKKTFAKKSTGADAAMDQLDLVLGRMTKPISAASRRAMRKGGPKTTMQAQQALEPVTFKDLIELRRRITADFDSQTSRRAGSIIDGWIKKNVSKYPGATVTTAKGKTKDLVKEHFKNQARYADLSRNWSRSQNPVIKKIASKIKKEVGGDFGTKISADEIAGAIIEPSGRTGTSNALAAVDMLKKNYKDLYNSEIRPELRAGIIGKITGRNILETPLTVKDYGKILKNMNSTLDDELAKKVFFRSEMNTLRSLRDRLQKANTLHDTPAKLGALTAVRYALRRIAGQGMTHFGTMVGSGAAAGGLGAAAMGGPILGMAAGGGALVGGAVAIPALASARASSKALAPDIARELGARSLMFQGQRVHPLLNRMALPGKVGGLLGREAARPPLPEAINEELEGLL